MKTDNLPKSDEYNISQLPATKLLSAMGYKVRSCEEGIEARGGIYNVIYKDILYKKLNELNGYEYRREKRKFSEKNILQAISDVDEPIIDGLVSANQRIYDLLYMGRAYAEDLPDGSRRSFTLRFIDWDNVYNNEFTLTEEFRVENDIQSGLEKKHTRPDIVLFVNGIPFVVIECKKASVSVEQGIEQTIRNQGVKYIPQLFKFSQILLSTNKNETKYATTGTIKKFWITWKEQNLSWLNSQLKNYINNRLATNQDRDLISLLHPERLLELVRFFILYDKDVKKICRYQQYFAIKEIAKTIEERDENNNRQSGTIWHTQGSGKSLTMVMFAKYVATKLSHVNPRVIIVTDRIELDKQITKTFLNTGLRTYRATTGKKLINLIKNDNADIVTTILNKFETASDYKIKDKSKDIFVLVDEGHRSNYGELYQKMKRVFPNACYLAFTGTPLMKKDKNTMIQFGHKLIHKYTINDGVQDKQILPLLYEGRMVDQSVNQRGIDTQIDIITRNLTDVQKQQVKQKWSAFSRIASSEQRINLIAFDINQHFVMNFKTKGAQFKAMLATNSKSEAFKYKRAFDEFGDMTTAVVVSAPDMREGEEEVDADKKEFVKNEYEKMIKPYRDAEEYEECMKTEFIEGDELDMLIVVSKLLTGFDAPRATVLYIDKKLQEHSLLQAIARVNRLYEGKEYGFIVDYRGLIGQLNTALGMYSGADLEKFDSEDLKGAVVDVLKIISDLRQYYSELSDIFRSVKNKAEQEEYEVFLADEKIRKDFYEAFSKFNKNLGYALSSEKVYSSLDDEEISRYKKALRFYQELRASVGRRYGDRIDHKEYEAKLQKLIDNYISADAVMQVTNPIDILNVKEFESELERMGSPRAKAEMIQSTMTKTIDSKYYFNPAYYDKFSQMIQKTIDDYRENRINEIEYLSRMQEILRRFQKGEETENVPESISNNKRAIAFYGVIAKVFSDNSIGIDDKMLERITIAIEDIISRNIKVDWQNNNEVHKAIEQNVEDYFYELEIEQGIYVPLKVVDTITNDIKTVAKNY